ncbi:hypothetical protein [Borrelia sp. RT1S]|nr:hypothetical protein [Borrelia sp. RT1S]UGQ17845.1 hypothetical protein LSO05_05285 [Borrelia sp. RT1S]
MKKNYDMFRSLAMLYLSIDTDKISYKECLRAQMDLDNIVKHKIKVGSDAICDAARRILGKKN